MKSLAEIYSLFQFLKYSFSFYKRKASLALIRKMIHFCSEALLKEVCDSDAGHNLPTVLVEITATVLDQEVNVICVFLFLLVLITVDFIYTISRNFMFITV